MQKLIQKQIVRVIIPAALGSIATYLATSFPAAYAIVCAAGAG